LQPLVIEGMKGLGDNIYQRAFVKKLCKDRDVFLETPWPELYEDLPVKFVRSVTSLRTQAKNLARQSRHWHGKPAGEVMRVSYGAELQHSSIMQAMASRFGCEPEALDLPVYKSAIKAKKPICVVRPVTVRKEWRAEARNPLPEYVRQAVERIRNDYFVVGVADLCGTAEYALNPLPYADLTLYQGELDIGGLLGLVQQADLVLGGVGWVVPACIASKTPLFCILGGNGGYNAPEKITDNRMDLRLVGFANPNSYCMCTHMQHRCNKTISNFEEQLEAYLGHIRSIQH
jgi:hypothetical protein